jgi:hypothetical protein
MVVLFRTYDKFRVCFQGIIVRDIFRIRSHMACVMCHVGCWEGIYKIAYLRISVFKGSGGRW